MESLETLEKRLELYRQFSDFIKKRKGYKFDYFLRSLFVFFEQWKQLTPPEARKYWLRAEKEWNKEKGWFALYIGIPFCKTRCSYCVYKSYKLEEPSQLEAYAENLLKEMGFFADAFRDVEFETFYYGGGTPSILEPDLLEKILEAVSINFRLREGGERTMEFNPDSTTRGKLEVAKRWGISRVSFGIQSLDDKVLKLAGRDQQKREHVEFALREARSLGFDQINVDLILGLWGDSNNSFIKTFEDTARLCPSTISIYPLQPMKDYLEKLGVSSEAINERVRKMLKEVSPDLLRVGERYDYLPPQNMYVTKEVTSWGFTHKSVIKPSEKTTSYFFASPELFGCLGLGPLAISRVRDRFWYQQEMETEDVSVPFSPESLLYRGFEMSPKVNMLRYVFDELSSPQASLDLSGFRERFECEFEHVFASELDALSKLKKIKIEGGRFHLLPENPKEAFSCAMFLFDEKLVEQKIKEMMYGRGR